MTRAPRTRGIPSAEDQVVRRRPIEPSSSFLPLPPPSGEFPYRRRLADVLGPAAAEEIRKAGRLRFHCLGDSGGWVDPGPQRDVAAAIVADRRGEEPADFLYHLGDVVYPHGEEGHYGAQFFLPYAGYDAPIFAIPGNHDGEAGFPRTRTLDPFVRAFCAASSPLRDATLEVPRPPARPPQVHWTRVHDWLWIVGMYSNLHEDGEIAEDQLAWLVHELAEAPRDGTVVLAVHRPVYSADIVHGSNLDLGDALDRCFAAAGRAPDVVLSAHAHNYQRFSRSLGPERSIPYIVSGAGGFHERHRLGSGIDGLPASFPGLPGVRLEAYDDSGHGFMTITVTPHGLEASYQIMGGRSPHVRDAWALRRPHPSLA